MIIVTLCRLVLKSIGYKSIPVPGLAFDERQGLVCRSWDFHSEVTGDRCRIESNVLIQDFTVTVHVNSRKTVEMLLCGL